MLLTAGWLIRTKVHFLIQHLHDAPYGELIDNQQATQYDERYKFTGKERDAETGYDFFGARNYSSVISTMCSS